MAAMPDAGSLLVVRHGNTFAAGEPARRIGARTDVPLTEEGRRQCRRLGEHLAREGTVFARALSGPLRRTVETAELILAAQQRAPVPMLEIDERLAEIDHGPDEDRPEEEVRRRLGQAAIDRWDREGEIPPGWRVDAADRLAFWRTFLAGGTRGTVLVVTSNGAARFALLALPPAQRPPLLKLRTAAFGRIAWTAGGGVRVKEWDERAE